MCPLCESDYVKVIYYGMPMRLCEKETCSCLFGFWSFIADHLPFNGFLYVYEGRYLPALWRWLVDGEQ